MPRAKASPFGRGVTAGDGEGKPGRKEPWAQRWAGSLSERYYRCVRAVWQRPCPLSRACARQLPQRGSHWHVGQLSSGRAKPDITQKIVPCYRGQQLRNHVPCQAAANLGSRALLFPDRVRFARPAWAWPTRQRLPLWGSWRTK